MKFRSFAVVSIISLLIMFNSNIYPQDCSDCGKRNIGVYDPSVLVPRPEGDDTLLLRLIPRWWQLFRSGFAMRYYLRNQDAQSCLYFTDINIMRAEPGSWSWKDSLVFGTEWANTAPPGPVNTLDYLIESSVGGTEGNYVLNASLQSAVSREVAATGSISFSDMWNAPDAAQQLAAVSFSPLYDKIRAWEEKKRDEDPEVAIGAETIDLYPEKTQIEVNEELTVNIEFKDCDGAPLKNKKLQLIGGEAYGITLEGPKGGKFTSTYVNTDSEGKAAVKFKAGDKPGEGILRVYFVYKYPSGHNGLAGGQKVISISQAPVDYWEVTGTASSTLNYSRDTSWSASAFPWKGFYKDGMNRHGSLNIRGLIRNESYEPGEFSYNENEPIVALFASGSMSETQMSDQGEYMMGKLVSGDKRTDYMNGNPIPDLVGIQFNYTADYKDASIRAGFTRKGGYNGKWFDGPDWVEYSGEYDDSLLNISAGCDDTDGSIIKSDTGYFASYSHSDSYTEETLHGTANVTETISFELSIRPYSYLTGVQSAFDNNISINPYLYQNYPNPFNGTTVINFYLSNSGHVTIELYDILGRKVAALADEFKEKGMHSIKFNSDNTAGRQLTSGIYFCRMRSGKFTDQKKFILMK